MKTEKIKYKKFKKLMLQAKQEYQNETDESKKYEIEDVVIKPDAPSFFDRLDQLANGKIASSLLQRLDGLSSIWHPNSL